MSITKSLKDISWLVDEPTYRADEALSYSTLSTYEREGKFEKLPTLFEQYNISKDQIYDKIEHELTHFYEDYKRLYPDQKGEIF